MAVAAVGVARLAAWALGVLLRLPLGERRGLPFARPVGLFQGRLELFYPLVLRREDPVFLTQFLLELTDGLAEAADDLL